MDYEISTRSPPRASFLSIPPEIREEIFRLILHPSESRLSNPDEYTDYDYRAAFSVLRLSRELYLEARDVFRELNVFVLIETPWPEAKEHVAFEGHVPVLMKDSRAAQFKHHSLRVVIDAPKSPIQDAEPQYFVILLDDLEKFTQTWYYADLSHPGLNKYLRLILELRAPYTPEWDEKRMPKWKQQRLLEPFGLIKGLGEMVVGGDPKPLNSVVQAVRKEQMIPQPSPEKCLSECNRLKLEGNKALSAGNPREALELYTKAWEAIHIVIKGRQRHTHADAFYGREMTEAPFKYKNGQAERLVLRISLVANTTLAYLKLEDWDEARFWGMRTIRMLREAMGAHENMELTPEQETMIGFAAADQMGKIYYRTAVAYRHLGEIKQAMKLLRVARLYLPHDATIRREYTECSLQE